MCLAVRSQAPPAYGRSLDGPLSRLTHESRTEYYPASNVMGHMRSGTRIVAAFTGEHILAAVVTLAVSGCATAPHGPYQGPVPAPGAVNAFTTSRGQDESVEWTGRPWLDDTDRARRYLGRLRYPPEHFRSDSFVVIVYGDNRPGPRLSTTPWGLGAIMDADRRDPLSLLWAAVNVPVLLVQAVVPSLDGFRDIASSRWTHDYTGGGEGRVLKAIDQERAAALIIHSGDMVENGNRGRHWERFARRHAALRTRVPFLATPGNHERTGDPLARFNWNAVIGQPADTLRYWFALDLPDPFARFVFLDSNVFADPKDRYPDSLETALAEEQLAWADSVLEAAPARYRRFVVLHHPLVSAGQHFSDWDRDDPGPRGRRARLLDLCLRHGVTAVFAGHEHLYQRLYVRAPGGRGLWQITSGGGGSPLHRISRIERRDAMGVRLPAGYHLVWEEPVSAYQYCRLTLLPGKDEVRLEVRRVLPSGATAPLETLDPTLRPHEDDHAER